MKVRELLNIKDSNIPNSQKAKMIVNMLKARSRRNNPQDGETPLGWNAGPTQTSGGTAQGGINL